MLKEIGFENVVRARIGHLAVGFEFFEADANAFLAEFSQGPGQDGKRH